MSEYRKYIERLTETSSKVSSMWQDSNGVKFSNVFLNPMIEKLSNIDWSIDQMCSEVEEAMELLRTYKEE